ncbi:MAG: hypothetical protein JWQ34_2597 [Mucilaginibacter sp.]|nr:hypothetical protein [Mucilaginibacter sp.]
MGGVIVKARENYKSRRVAAAQRRTLCVRTGLQSRPPRPFLLLFLRRTGSLNPCHLSQMQRAAFARRGLLQRSENAVGGGRDRNGILPKGRYNGEPGP